MARRKGVGPEEKGVVRKGCETMGQTAGETEKARGKGRDRRRDRKEERRRKKLCKSAQPSDYNTKLRALVYIQLRTTSGAEYYLPKLARSLVEKPPCGRG